MAFCKGSSIAHGELRNEIGVLQFENHSGERCIKMQDLVGQFHDFCLSIGVDGQ